MGRLVIKRADYFSLHKGKGLKRCPFISNTRYTRSNEKQNESMVDWKPAKDTDDAHLTVYYSTPRKGMGMAKATEEDNITDESIDGENSDEDQTVSSIEEGAKGIKRKRFPASFIDSIINGTTEEPSMAPQAKIMCLDTSLPESHKNNDSMNSNHTLSKIPPTERKKWPQKACVLCRKYGFRNDTRYICIICNAALCKEACFSQYHCNK